MVSLFSEEVLASLFSAEEVEVVAELEQVPPPVILLADIDLALQLFLVLELVVRALQVVPVLQAELPAPLQVLAAFPPLHLVVAVEEEGAVVEEEHRLPPPQREQLETRKKTRGSTKA